MLRNILMSTIFSLVILICAFGSLTSQASPIVRSVRLEELLEGVSVTKQMRLQVTDIKVGTETVTHLFNHVDQREPSWWEYYTFEETTIRLTIKGREKLAQLQQILTDQHKDRVSVILKDDRNVIWRYLPGLRSEQLYSTVWEFIIAKTPCDELTRIVYTSINSIIRKEFQKAITTARHINIIELFDKLLLDAIEPYMDSLDPISKDDPCLKTFQLLRWIEGENIAGFDSGEYRLHEGLQRALEPAVAAILEVSPNWSHYTLSVKVVGHTDSEVVITEKYFRLENTGIDEWDHVEDPLNVRYNGCRNDRITRYRPVYVDFGKTTGERVEHISDNCKLGAVRAYVATAYLRNKLGVQGVQYSYATGGIYSTRDTSDKNHKRADSTKRRINIELIIKAARAEDR